MHIMAAIEPPSIPVHYHHDWLIWLLFFFGLAVHTLLQVDTISRTTKVPRLEIFKEAWIRILYRETACSVIFGTLWLHPYVFFAVAKFAHITFAPDEADVLVLPMNNLIAIGAGLCFDSLLGYIPWFKSQVPSIEVPIQQALADAAGAQQTAAAKIETARTIAANPSDVK